MLGVIKTAIITIIISFISGVLLDTYKNYAPRLLCNMRKLKNSKGKNSNLKTYVFTVKNTSKKIIHDLNINIHNNHNSLKVYDTKISNGLEFHTSSENNNFNVSIPFLSKEDEISLKIKVEDTYGGKTKPIITLRSPEDFKKIYARNSKELLSISNDKVNDIRMKGGTFYRNRKLILIIGVILILIYAGVVVGEYTNKKLEEKNTSNNNETVSEHDTTSKNITSADNNNLNDKPEQKSTSSKSKSESIEKNNTSNNSTNISNANSENKNEEDKSNTEKNSNEETNNQKENSKVNEDENSNTSKEDNTNKKEISDENKKEKNKEIIPNENPDMPIKDDNKN